MASRKACWKSCRTLTIALEKQEITLSNWPDSPSKARICSALAKARDTVSRVVADLARQRPENWQARYPRRQSDLR